MNHYRSAAAAPYVRDEDGTVLVRLLQLFPDVAAGLGDEDAEVVARTVVFPIVDVPSGPVDLPTLVEAPGVRGTPAGAVLVQGLAAVRRPAGQRAALRLHGPGEMLGLPDGSDASTLEARGRARFAIIDDRLIAAARRYPGLTAAFVRWGLAQAAMADALAADTRRPRVEDRLVAVLASLMERQGRATTAGQVLELPITHSELGQLIGAARPTISIALMQLQAEGRLLHPESGLWILPHETPASRPELDGSGPPRLGAR